MADMRLAALAAAAVLFVAVAAASADIEDGGYLGRHSTPVKPESEWSCPDTHPIKGNFRVWKRTKSYYLPGDRYYNIIKPEICFSSEYDARNAGYVRPRD